MTRQEVEAAVEAEKAANLEIFECEYHGTWCTCYMWDDYRVLVDGRCVPWEDPEPLKEVFGDDPHSA